MAKMSNTRDKRRARNQGKHVTPDSDPVEPVDPFEVVLNLIEDTYDVDRDYLMNVRRSNAPAPTRNLAMWLVFTSLDWTWDDVADRWDRTRGTIIPNVRKIAEKRREDEGFRRHTDSLISAVRQNLPA